MQYLAPMPGIMGRLEADRAKQLDKIEKTAKAMVSQATKKNARAEN